jgi:lysophospholipase L1-like esterase
MLSMTHQKKQRVVFFGDSITQAGVEAGGYITRIGENLAKKGAAAQYELVGAGISGNKVYDLYLRLENDVLAKNPDIVVIWVGVNDVWHKTSYGTGTDADKFENFIRHHRQAAGKKHPGYSNDTCCHRRAHRQQQPAGWRP